MSDVADPSVRLSGIRDRPLRVDEVISAVADPVCGAVATFVGTVRDHDGGRAVASLEYSAHPSADDRLLAVCQSVADQHRVNVAAEHRVGPLQIGDVAVALAVSSPHRDAAFSACRALIDTLKEQVPIWKRQVFSDGSEEWVGSHE